MARDVQPARQNLLVNTDGVLVVERWEPEQSVQRAELERGVSKQKEVAPNLCYCKSCHRLAVPSGNALCAPRLQKIHGRKTGLAYSGSWNRYVGKQSAHRLDDGKFMSVSDVGDPLNSSVRGILIRQKSMAYGLGR